MNNIGASPLQLQQYLNNVQLQGATGQAPQQQTAQTGNVQPQAKDGVNLSPTAEKLIEQQAAAQLKAQLEASQKVTGGNIQPTANAQPATNAQPTANANPTQEGGDNTKTVTVKKGDTVWKLLEAQGFSKKEIFDNKLVNVVKELNNLKDPNKIMPGQTLKLPQKGNAQNTKANASPTQVNTNQAPVNTNANASANATQANNDPKLLPANPKLVKPLDAGNYKVTSEFGPRFDGMHIGIDLGAYKGTQIRSVSDGVVSIVGKDPSGYGNYVQVDHNDGTKSVYGHMSKFGNIQKGQKVAAGSVIGYVGSTGRSTGPHLHFEYRDKSGTPVNPRKMFKF